MRGTELVHAATRVVCDVQYCCSVCCYARGMRCAVPTSCMLRQCAAPPSQPAPSAVPASKRGIGSTTETHNLPSTTETHNLPSLSALAHLAISSTTQPESRQTLT
eukprot:3940655-Rhodomonas_salina.4